MSAVGSASVSGTRGRLLTISAHTEAGPESFVQLGFPGNGRDERQHRIRDAVKAAGLEWPGRRLTVVAAPGELPKPVATDLAIAVAVLAASRTVPGDVARNSAFCAGLNPDGTLEPVPGILPSVNAIRTTAYRSVVVAAANAAEASMVPGLEVIAARSLAEVVAWLRGGPRPTADPPRPARRNRDLSKMPSQPLLSGALQVSAAGGHHLAWLGSPRQAAALSRLIPRLLPPLIGDEAAEAATVQSAAGLLAHGASFVPQAPLAAPPATVTAEEFAGGWGPLAAPGSVSLAHQGVLFLQDAPSYSTSVMDILRQALDEKEVQRVVRFGGGKITRWYPADFILAISAAQAAELDDVPDAITERISLRIPVSDSDSPDPSRGEPMPIAVSRVARARKRAADRLADTPWSVNAAIPDNELYSDFRPDPASLAVVERAVDTGRISPSEAAGVIRVAWTVADLADHSSPSPKHCATALAYRTGDAR